MRKRKPTPKTEGMIAPPSELEPNMNTTTRRKQFQREGDSASGRESAIRSNSNRGRHRFATISALACRIPRVAADGTAIAAAATTADAARSTAQRRPSRASGHSSAPRRPQLIADMLKQGQEIIVQIAKEPLGKKGARITSHVALPGRFLVYMPTLDHTGVSRKIASAEERARLRHLVNDAKGSAGGGFIVRTAAAAPRLRRKFAPTSNSSRARGPKSRRARSRKRRRRCCIAI